MSERTEIEPSNATNFDIKDGFPYWLVVMLGIIGWMVVQIIITD